jgi:hypothetical protein
MANLSSQKLTFYYDKYAEKEIAFTTSILKTTGLETKKVFLKIKAEHFPCILYSISMKVAKIIISLDASGFEEIKIAKNFVNLRLSFFPNEAKSPVTFFVPCIVKGYNTFNTKSTSYLMSLEFSQKPPDDLIEVLGRILELSEMFEKRKTLRINVEGKVADDLGFNSVKHMLLIDNIKRPCIIRNVSASGCLVVMSCNPKFIMNKKSLLHISLKNSTDMLVFEGMITRTEEVADRQDIYGIGIQFVEGKIPFQFKEMLNEYIDKLEELMKKKS